MALTGRVGRSVAFASVVVALSMVAVVVADCGTTPSPVLATAATTLAPPTAGLPTPVPTAPSSGSATGSSQSPDTGPSSSPASSAAGPSLVGRLGCQGNPEISFPASALDQPANAELAQNIPALALRTFVSSPDAEGFPTSGWRVVSAGPDRVDYLAAGREGWRSVSVENIADQGGWQAWEYGQCDLEVRLPEGFGFASWELDPAHPPTPDATTLTVLATEVACASGRSMTGRLTTPIVLATPDAVTIALVVRTRPGNQDCQGNPAEPVAVELGEPLGDRGLFDGSAFPGQRRD